MDLDGVFEDGEAELMRDLEGSTAEDVTMRTRLLENEIRVLRDESNRLALDLQSDKERVKENMEKIKMNKQLPYLVGNVVEILDLKPEVRHTGHVNKFPERSERRAGTPRRIVRSGCAPRRQISSTNPRSLADPRARARPEPPLEPRKQEEEEEEDGGNVDLDSRRQGKAVVLKTTTRQTIFLPVIGLVDGGAHVFSLSADPFFLPSARATPRRHLTITHLCPHSTTLVSPPRADALKPADLVGVNKDSYLILDTLPAEYDSRVKAMEVDEKPTEDYSDIGGLDKQIQELREAVVLPMTHAEKFKTLGIRAPKGVLLYGPPGTGKTLIARACAAQTNAAYLKLAGPLLVQMFIGDGAKLVRDAFALAKTKAPAIIFIDEIDAIGTKRFDSDTNGDREVQRTMLELLNQLDGFSSDDRVKIIAATNRADILDPALLRSGRLDRKIEFPHPNEDARAQIMEIHARKMNVSGEVNYEELARSTDDFNAAQLKAVCVEAGMLALRRDGTEVNHEDFNEGIIAVQAKKKADLFYYA